VLFEIVQEPAHDDRLLRLSEAGHTIVYTDETNLGRLFEEEEQAQVVPFLDLFLAILPVIILDKHRFLVNE
jgi:hypothetical protein